MKEKNNKLLSCLDCKNYNKLKFNTNNEPHCEFGWKICDPYSCGDFDAKNDDMIIQNNCMNCGMCHEDEVDGGWVCSKYRYYGRKREDITKMVFTDGFVECDSWCPWCPEDDEDDEDDEQCLSCPVRDQKYWGGDVSKPDTSDVKETTIKITDDMLKNVFKNIPVGKIDEHTFQSETNRYNGKMDEQCIALCDTLNELPGVRTRESCCGHNEQPYRIWFTCDDPYSIAVIARAIDIRYSPTVIRWNCQVETIDSDCNPQFFYCLKSNETYDDYDLLNRDLQYIIADIKYWSGENFYEYFKHKSIINKNEIDEKFLKCAVDVYNKSMYKNVKPHTF